MKHTKIMGILNVTPDSFFDGGKYTTLETAKRRIEEMVEEGVDIIDVGGFSSRPGSTMPEVEEELERIFPVLEYLESLDVAVSVDTCRSEVVKEIVRLKNISYINDISGLADENILEYLHPGIGYILMHTKGTPDTMQNNPFYEHILEEMIGFFEDKIAIIKKNEVKNIVIDPGFGFGKTIEHNYEVLRNIDTFHQFGLPILVGISRKSMIYKLLQTSPDEVLAETSALHLFAILKGVDILRVHDVRTARHIIALAQNLRS